MASTRDPTSSKSSKRLSRVTPSEFDTILNSHTTRVVSAVRDESQLGRVAQDLDSPLSSTSARFVASSPNTSASLSTDTSSSPKTDSSASPDSSLTLRRQSSGTFPDSAALDPSRLYSGGTASAPFVLSKDPPAIDKRKSSYRPQIAPGLAESSEGFRRGIEPMLGRERHPSRGGDEQFRDGARPSPPAKSPATSPVRIRTSASSPMEPRSSTSSSLAVPGETVSATTPKRTRVSDVSIGTLNSYVHVPSPSSSMDPPTSAVYGSATDNSSKVTLDFSPRKLRPSTAARGDDESQKSTWSQNTMRKTSRFFRMLGGGGGASSSGSSSSQPASSTAPSAKAGAHVYGRTTSAPITPIASQFTMTTNAPPVPAIPSGYSADRRPSAASTLSHTPPIPIVSPASPPLSTTSDRSPSLDVALTQQTVLAREGSSATLHVKKPGHHSRQRSMSLGSASSSPRLSHNSESPRGTTPTQRTANGKTTGIEEAERLQSELLRWKLNTDGVLGSVDDVTPVGLGLYERGAVGKNYSAPPTLGAATSRHSSSSSSIPAVSPPPAVSTSTSNPSSAALLVSAPLETRQVSTGTTDSAATIASTEVIPASSETSLPISMSVPSPVFPSPLVNPFPPSPKSDVDASFDTPSIRLVEPSSSPPTEGSSSPIEERPRRADSGSAGLGSESVPEGGNSTPIKLTDSNGPTVLKQSPTPISASAELNKKLARHSVVGYPSRAAATRTDSVASLQSEVGGGRRASSRSLDGGSSGGEDGSGKTDSPAGLSLEERARSLAQQCWDDDRSFLEPKKIAEWLGSSGRLNSAALRVYIDKFQFAGLRLDMAFRKLCEKLYLKAETQQVDRILEQFSRKFWEDNPKAIYGSADIVHAVSYSLLLLNTDLHVVDSTTRMTRNQFVRNTLFAINAQTGDPATTPALLFGAGSADDNDSSSVFGGPDEAMLSRKSLDQTLSKTISRRHSALNSWRSPSASNPNLSHSPLKIRRPSTAGPLPTENSPAREVESAPRAFEGELDATLKEIYNAVKAQPIFQPQDATTPAESRSSMSLTASNSPYGSWSGINRTVSRRSGTSTTNTSGKRSSIRGFSSFLGATSSSDFNRSSSPTPSTATSLSDEHLASAYHNVPTIGFANSLSHTIIREQQEDDAKSIGGVSISDEELALLGPPWAKEGIVYRKHYWESTGKRSKEKNWLQVFVVISQGALRMFRFDGGGTTRGGRGGVGGGDWSSTANSVGEISLAHALCSAMPPPGYSRDRPHCFVLTLPGGGSYFFHAGTQDLVGEWVATCNYWSARLSKEPLSGGVSNMEYGWNRIETDDDLEEVASIRSGKSGRSSRSRFSHTGSVTPSFMGAHDRILINDWKAPALPAGASSLSEDVQLDSLRRHVVIVKAELAAHQAIRSPMIRLYTPRSVNLAKALANWERKSQHLLGELLKWETYAENLSSAVRLRAIRRGQKEVEDMLQAADEEEDEYDILPTDTGPSEFGTIPPPPVAASLPILNTSEASHHESCTSTHQKQMSIDVGAASIAESTDDFYDVDSSTPSARSEVSQAVVQVQKASSP